MYFDVFIGITVIGLPIDKGIAILIGILKGIDATYLLCNVCVTFLLGIIGSHCMDNGKDFVAKKNKRKKTFFKDGHDVCVSAISLTC